MFDLGASELLLIVIVAVIVIGPKDLPLALRTAGRWIGKVRRLSNHFRAGLDAMIREAEMEDMEKKWREQNERIMAQDPATLPVEMEPTGALPARRPAADPASAEAAAGKPTPAPAPQSGTVADTGAPGPEGAGLAQPERDTEPAGAPAPAPPTPPAGGS